MSAIKSKDTKPERLLAKTLWHRGFRYRKHYPIKGNPDLAFVSAKVAVFCDGDFWHGNNWRIRGLSSFEEELSRYTPFWRKKIMKNIERDKEVNRTLKKLGWLVLRFWESEINRDVGKCADTIEATLRERCHLE
jgi:DNA mismatch endonuclease (patch repair protein)